MCLENSKEVSVDGVESVRGRLARNDLREVNRWGADTVGSYKPL